MSTELVFDPSVADRVVSLEGVHNFRKIEGWRTDDGRSLQRGRLYRASSLHDLNEADLAALTPLAIEHIVDLRTASERDQYVTRWSADRTPSLWNGAEGSANADLSRLMGRAGTTLEDFRTGMTKVYADFPSDLAEALRDLFKALLDLQDEAAVLIHCAAGKDRTGFVVAMLLRALGIREEDVQADYLLTNATFDRAFSAFSAGHGLDQLETCIPGVSSALLGAHLEYLASADAAVQAGWGSIDRYLAEAAELSLEGRKELQARFLTPTG